MRIGGFLHKNPERPANAERSLGSQIFGIPYFVMPTNELTICSSHATPVTTANVT